MPVSVLAGKPAPESLLANVPRLVAAYYSERPDPSVAAERVAFGTSGHRGSALSRSFNETHILAITQAICDHRASRHIDGPLFIGMDTHALSEPAFISALEVLAANGVTTLIDQDRGYTPTPVVSHAILVYNRGRASGLADGIVITPSHNPPEDGGFKYNPPNGGPADTTITTSIETTANALMTAELAGVRRVPWPRARRASTTRLHDFATPYIDDLPSVVDLATVSRAGVRVGIDPLGGAGARYWDRIADVHHLDATVVNTSIDPTFRFMTVDWDGRIRMDCSSPYAMTSLIDMKDRFDVAFGNDTDHDRHGIVTPSSGLMNPNHYLTLAIDYLFTHRPGWPADAGVGKTIVSSSLIDRVTSAAGRGLIEVPVGFKWFVEGLLGGAGARRLGFAGEESAGGSFLRMDGRVWTTDKDGMILGLLAAEITAVLDQDPGERYEQLTKQFGAPIYERVDAPSTPEQKQRLSKLSASDVTMKEIAGEAVRLVQTSAPGNGASIGGVKVITDSGWFAVRPSGTEAVYKVYAETFRDRAHLEALQAAAHALVEQLAAT